VGEADMMTTNDARLTEKQRLDHCPVCVSADISEWQRVKGWPLYKCACCAMVFSNPMPTEAALTLAYALPQPEYDAFFQTNCLDTEMILGGGMDNHRYQRAGRFLDQLERELPERGRLFELGCGPGAFLEAAQQRGWLTSGTDPGDWQDDLERDRNLGIQRCSLFDAEIEPGSIDTVFVSSVLEHIGEPMRYLRHFHKILRPGGVLLVVGLPNVKSLTISLGVDEWIGNHPPLHLQYFSPVSIRKALQLAGFSCCHTYSFGLSETLLEKVFNRKGQKYSGDYANIVYQENLKARLVSGVRKGLYWLFDKTGTGSVLEVLARKPVK